MSRTSGSGAATATRSARARRQLVALELLGVLAGPLLELVAREVDRRVEVVGFFLRVHRRAVGVEDDLGDVPPLHDRQNDVRIDRSMHVLRDAPHRFSACSRSASVASMCLKVTLICMLPPQEPPPMEAEASVLEARASVERPLRRTAAVWTKAGFPSALDTSPPCGAQYRCCPSPASRRSIDR